MGKAQSSQTFTDLLSPIWLRIIRDIDKLKRVYEIGNNIVSFFTINLLRFLAVREALNARVIVEVGSGPGTFLKKLRKVRNKIIIAIDPSPSMIFYSFSRYPFANHLIGLAEKLPLREDSVDIIYCVFSFRDFFNKLAFISEAFRVLRSGGKLVIVDTNNSGTLSTRLFLIYIMIIGKLLSLLLNSKRNILAGLIASIARMKPIEHYIADIARIGFKKILVKKFLLNNAFILIAIK